MPIIFACLLLLGQTLRACEQTDPYLSKQQTLGYCDPLVLRGSSRMTMLASGNLEVGTTNPNTKLQVAGDISPSVTNSYSLGTASLLFTAVYATNGTIQTSDAKKKRFAKQNSQKVNQLIQMSRSSFHMTKKLTAMD